MSEANLIFDTHASVEELTASGMPKKQAEAVIAVQLRIINSNLATKQDLANTAARLELKIAETNTNLVKWIANFGMVIIGLIVGLAALILTR